MQEDAAIDLLIDRAGQHLQQALQNDGIAMGTLQANRAAAMALIAIAKMMQADRKKRD